MINNKSAGIASSVYRDITKTLEDDGRKLSTIVSRAGSPLSDLTSIMASRLANNPGTEELSPYDISSLSLPLMEGMEDEHTIMVNNIARDLRDLVDTSYLFASTVALPIVKSVYTSVKTFLEGDGETPSDLISRDDLKFQVIKDELPAIFNNDMFVEMLQNITNDTDTGTITEDNSANIAPHDIDMNDFLESISSGFSDVDTFLRETLFSDSYDLGSDFYHHAIAADFSAVCRGLIHNSATTMDKLRYFFISKYLSNKPEVYSSNLGKESKQERMTSSMVYYAIDCVRAITDRVRVIKEKALTLDIDFYSKVVVVYSEVYDQWLEAGGSPEVLFGHMIANPKSQYGDYDKLLESADSLRDVYKEYNIARLAEDKEKRASLLSRYLKRILAKTVEQEWNNFEESRYADSLDIDYVTDKLLCAIDNVDFSTICDAKLFVYIRDILCQLLWIKSNTFDTFMYMDKTKELLDTETPEVCAEMVKTYMITDYVCSQLSITSTIVS